VAYIVARGAAPDPASLRAHLQQTIPEYMVPSAFVALPSLPLTSNGKLDRAALPDPDAARLQTSGYVEPGEGTEQALAAIARDVLRLERVGAHDNFFDLGADSLLLAMMHTRLREAFGLELSLVALYKHPTVSALAASLAPPAGDAPDAGRAIQERATRQRQARRQRRRT
jgi:acyl carrier protein